MKLLSAAMVYDSWSQSYDDDTQYKIGWLAPERVFEALNTSCAYGSRLFELGIGTGHLAQRFARACGADLWGVDASQGMLDQLSQKRELKLQQMQRLDAEQAPLSYSDCFFDAAYSCGVLEYMEDPAIALQETVRVTRPGGIIVHCFETEFDVTERRNHLCRSTKGLTDTGEIQFGSFFYYHHPAAQIADQLVQAGCTLRALDVFNSTPQRADFDPVRYALIAVQKNTPDIY